MRLQNKFILLFISILLLTFIINIFLAYFLIASTLTHIQKEEIRVAGELLRNSLEGKLKNLLLMLNLFFLKSDSLKNQIKEIKSKVAYFEVRRRDYLIKNWENPPDLPPFPILFQNPLHEYVERVKKFSSLPVTQIIITDDQGLALAFLHKPSSPFLPPVKRGENDFFLCRTEGKILSLSFPLEEKGITLGSVRVEVNLENIFKPLRLFSLGRTGTAHLLEKGKLLLSSSNWKGGEREYRDALKNRNYLKETWNLRIFTPSTTSPWELVLLKDKREDRVILVETFRNILRQFLIFLLLFILIGVYFSRYLTSPLKSIEKFAHRLARGRLSYRLRINTGDEMESLAKSLNLMAEKLEDMMRVLEEEKRNLQKISETKSLFLSAVSHEFKTPLTIINNYAHLLAGGKLGEVNPDQVERLRRISRHARYLIKLVDNLLNLSRLEAGEWETQMEEFPLRKILEETSKEFAPLARNKGVKLSLELPSRLPHLRSDPYALRTVLDNLVENAIKFTPSGGRVIIRGMKVGDRVRVEVEDSGPGIPPEEREKIFQPFYRVDREETRKGWGTGLGLAITRALLDLLNGKIEALEGKEGGALFRITLPIMGGEDGKDNGGG